MNLMMRQSMSKKIGKSCVCAHKCGSLRWIKRTLYTNFEGKTFIFEKVVWFSVMGVMVFYYVFLTGLQRGKKYRYKQQTSLKLVEYLLTYSYNK